MTRMTVNKGFFWPYLLILVSSFWGYLVYYTPNWFWGSMAYFIYFVIFISIVLKVVLVSVGRIQNGSHFVLWFGLSIIMMLLPYHHNEGQQIFTTRIDVFLGMSLSNIIGFSLNMYMNIVDFALVFTSALFIWVETKLLKGFLRTNSRN